MLDEEEGLGSQTRSGMAMGTPAYMAPEQVRSAKNVDLRADIFALGCILYELVSGDRPFHGEDLLETMTAVCAGHYAPLDSAIPERVRATVAACLVVDREKRVADCAGVRRLLGGEAVSGSPRESADPTVAGAVGGVGSAVPALSGPRGTSAPRAGVPAGQARTYAADSMLPPTPSLLLPAPDVETVGIADSSRLAVGPC